MKFLSSLIILLTLLSGFALGHDIKLIYDDDNKTSFVINFDSPSVKKIGGGYFLISCDGFGYRGSEGGPWLLGKIYNLSVRRDDDVNVSVESIDWSDWQNIIPAPICSLTIFHSIPGAADSSLYSQVSGGTVEIARDYIMRGVRIIGIDVIPVQYDPERGTRFMRSIKISVKHTGGNEPIWNRRYYHPAFAQYFRSTVINWRDVIPDEPVASRFWSPDSGAELLVIADPSLLDAAEPWLEWKLLMGIPTIVATVDTIGSDTTSVKAFIQNAYDTWSMPPAFVLFLGDAEVVPTFREWTSTGCIGDNNYGTVDGDDIVPDIFPGRLSADVESEMRVIVQKHINYEKEPDTTDDWYARFVGVVREEDCPFDGGPVDSSYLAAVNYAAEQCLAAGYSSAEVFTKCSGDNASTVRPYLEAGCNFANYRGQAVMDWWEPFGGILTSAHGKKLPIFVSITCAMGGFQDDGYPCEYVTRCGSVSEPCGGVAWYSQARCSWNSLERSSLSKHIFEGFFEAKLNWLASADTYGKNGMLDEFGPTSAVLNEYLSTTLLGSPEMMAWTAHIQVPDIEYPDVVPWGPNSIVIGVSASGEPVKNARVCFHQGDSLIYSFTDSTGTTLVAIDVQPFIPLVMVVTGANMYPIIDTIEVLTGGVILVSVPDTFFDIEGNGDGLLNPGERIAFMPKISNLGDDDADSGYFCIVRTNDPLITFVDSISSFPYIAPDDTVCGDSVIFVISDEHYSSDGLNLSMLLISPDSTDTVERNIITHPKVHRFFAELDTVIIYDMPPFGNGNGYIEPGEQFEISVVLRDTTQADGFNIEAELSNWTEISYIYSECEYSALLRDSTAVPERNFIAQISRNAPPGLDFSLDMTISADCGTYSYCDTLELSLTILGDPIRLPTGSDEYGYYIIDNTDLIDDFVPEYEWNDISSVGEAISGITDRDDGIVTVKLPFPFRFYGYDYDSVSISSNGFLAPEFCSWSGPGTGVPQAMPHSGGPAGVIAALWADLAPHHSGGDIYSYYDAEKHQFVVQYDSVDFYSTSGFVSMQIRICDTEAFPTPTGDSEIFIYYNGIVNPVNFAVGIESPDETDGLQYCYLGTYDENAAPIEAARALRITTNIPTFGHSPWLVYADSLSVDDMLGDSDGIIEPGDSIAVCFKLRNGGNSTASDIDVFAVSTDVVSSSFYVAHFGTIEPGNAGFNDGSPVVFEIASFCPEDTFIIVPFAVYANSGTYRDTIGIPIQVGGDASSIENVEIPEKLNVLKVHPNPFNDNAVVEVYIDGDEKTNDCDISLFNLNGKREKTVFSGRISIGKHKFTIDGKDLSTGVYLLKMRIGNDVCCGKILLVK
ncbi:T9SS type A sorting domain-containing protein [bacterium]|nr:T9SS type A sorting domain-containing protein [bacterium]